MVMGVLTLLGWPSALQHSSPFHSHASAQETSLEQGHGCLEWDGALILPAHHNKATSFCTLPFQCGTALGMSPWL